MIDLSDLVQLKQYLSSFDLKIKKSLGQNFLIDSSVLDSIIDAACLVKTDNVIEVGPGPGALSQRIAPRVFSLVSVEMDEDMISPWEKLMSNFTRSKIIHLDVLRYSPADVSYKLVANIPYYITSPILKHFLRNDDVRRPDKVVLLIQKEVAQRICSKKKPTLLSWEIRVFGEPKLVRVVSPSSFYPSPKVDSAVLLIDVYGEPLLPDHMIDDFFSLLSLSYRQPRKTLWNNLSVGFQKNKSSLKEVFIDSHIDPSFRAHQLDLDQWKSLLSVWKDS